MIWLCTKSDSLSGVFVQLAILHKNSLLFLGERLYIYGKILIKFSSEVILFASIKMEPMIWQRSCRY